MDYLKEFFESEGAEKTFDAFTNWVKGKGYKLADLSKGEYEAKAKTERLIAEKEAAAKAGYKTKIRAAKLMAAKARARAAKSKTGLADGEKEKREKEKLENERKLKELEGRLEIASRKQKEAIEKLKAENEAEKQARLLAERKSLYIQAGGKQKNLDRDLSYLSNLVSEENSFEEVLDKYKADNPDVFTADKGTVSTVPDLKGGDKAELDKEIAAARRGAGLPPEKT